mmetsp:Transcript_15773/g.23092  ORF Transcript_15773/g.23092 Transcript_15773/m.23092 type:complete len:94 (+) Transcript_15773:53-334(+)
MTDDTALLVSLNNNPLWLPQEYIQKKIRQILCAALVITVLHLVLLKVFSVLLANRSASSAKPHRENRKGVCSLPRRKNQLYSGKRATKQQIFL